MARSIAPRGAAPFVLGLCGPQGSGKSTAARVIRRRLIEAGRSCAVVSIDDFYLRRAERQALAHTVHPLLATRGPPGTHDVGLALSTFERLGRPGQCALPRFDKGRDDRAPEAEWPVVRTPADIVIFEGWCVGARPQPAEALVTPLNALEREEDRDGGWRRFVNERLAGDYQILFSHIDSLVLLQAPFEQVLAWRTDQEHELARSGGGPKVMNDQALARFIQFYERISRWIEAEMPARADRVIRLNADRDSA
ncbi:MAG TPA: kinase [Caulobacteraceae bacterium]|nr:kinase [Caulobacteraceae bacterium]